MFEWTDPKAVKTYTQYYLYLLFSYQGRIGRADFARGFFLGFLGLALILYISIIILMIVFTNIFGEELFWLFLLLGILAVFFSVIPPVCLTQKRLKDIGFGEDARALIIFVSFIGILAWLLGPILLIIICLGSSGQKFGNPYGEECTLYEDLERRRENLVNAAESCLGRNDFKGAIQHYIELGDNGLVKKVKKAHLSHNYDQLYSQVVRMNDKGVLCGDLVGSTNDLSFLVNSYLGLKPQEQPSNLPKSENSLSFSESESGKEEVTDAPIETIEMAAEVVEVEAEVIEVVEAEVIEGPAAPAPDLGESGVDDIPGELSEHDGPENAPKKKEKKSE